jgi:hypothetical protein
MWRRPRLVTADTKSPAPQPALSGWWRGAFAPDPATGTEAGPGPTTPRRSAVRRASWLRGRCHASQAWRRALLARRVSRLTPPGAPPIPSVGGRQRRRCKEGEEPGGKNAPGMKKTALFDMVNRKRRAAQHWQGAGAPSRQRQRTRVPAERAPRRAFLHEVSLRRRAGCAEMAVPPSSRGGGEAAVSKERAARPVALMLRDAAHRSQACAGSVNLPALRGSSA